MSGTAIFLCGVGAGMPIGALAVYLAFRRQLRLWGLSYQQAIKDYSA